MRARPFEAPPLRAGILAALLAMLLGATAAAAQSFLGTGPAERLTVPPTGDALRRAQSPAEAAPRVGNAPAEALAPARRLPAGTRGFRLSGESDALRYPIYLTQGQARAGGRLQVSYLSAISVAPETSELSVTVNGAKVGWTRVQAPGAVKVVEFALPDGSLRAGYNAIGFSVRQRHRVDCSVEATYELWTQIDPSRTGLIVPPAGADLALSDLAALEPDESGALPVRLLLTEKPGLARLQRMIEAVQAVALVGRLARPAVEFGPPLSGRSGVNLVVGTSAEIRATEGLEAIGPVTGPKLALLPDRPGHAPTLVVTGPGEADVAEAIRTLAASGPTAAAPGAELAGLTRGYDVQGGESVSVDKLGLVSQEFDGRLLRAGFELRFPADFVPADYGKVMLHLAGGSSGGLTSRARIVVDVNGANAASVPLAAGKGEVFEDSAIPIPLGMWRPGLNRLVISAQVPREADETCDAQGQDAGRPRFLFLDRTRIEVPRLARAVRDPDLAAIKAGAIPFLAGSRRARLVLPNPDSESAAAAAMIVARMAIAARRVIPFDVVSEVEAPGGASLVVAPARALTPATLAAAGLDPERVRAAWEGRAATVPAPALPGEGPLTLDRLRRNLPVRCTLPPAIRPQKVADAADGPVGRSRPAPETPSDPSPRREPAGSATAPVSASSDDLAARWDERLRERPGSGPSLVDRLSEAWGELSRHARDLWDKARDFAGLDGGNGFVDVDQRATLIMAESAGATSFDGSLTVVTAPNAWMLKASASCLVDPVVWTQMLGRAVFLNAADGGFTIAHPERTALFETRERSLGNLWLVAAAWLSLNPAAYVGLMLLMALCLGLATAALVRETGRRNT